MGHTTTTPGALAAMPADKQLRHLENLKAGVDRMNAAVRARAREQDADVPNFSGSSCTDVLAFHLLCKILSRPKSPLLDKTGRSRTSLYFAQCTDCSETCIGSMGLTHICPDSLDDKTK